MLLLHRNMAFNMIVPGPLKSFRHGPLIGDGAINWCCAIYVSVADLKIKNERKAGEKNEKKNHASAGP